MPDLPDASETRASPSSTVTELVIPRLNFGERLLHLRLDNDLSMEEVAKQTKLTPGTIANLESGDFARILETVSPHYCKCHIERLCLCYDQPADEIIEAFELEYSAFVQTHPASAIQDGGFELTQTSVAPRRLSAILIGFITVLMLVLVLSGWGYQRYQQSQRKKRPSADLNLPSLLESPRLPMDALPIPAN